jgi:hypothetical protein
MKSYSNNKNAFSLVEVIMALTILELVVLSLITVINRSISSASDSELQMQAFEVARENMEKLLCKTMVQQSVDSGTSEKYPGIEWKTVVETFYEPITTKMWLRGICQATYTDSQGKQQTLELTHWLTGLSTVELLQIMWQQEAGTSNKELLETTEQAAIYAGVDVQTIEQWLDNGLFTTENGAFIKSNLDIYKNSSGNPPEQTKVTQIKSREELEAFQLKQSQQSWRNQTDPQTGLTYRELENMNPLEIVNAIQAKRKK